MPSKGVQQSDRRPLRAPFVAALVCVLLVLAPTVASPVWAQPSAPSYEQAEQALASGRHEEAERDFRRLLLREPDSSRALDGWARSLAAQGRGIEAMPSLLGGGGRHSSRGEFAAAVRLFGLASTIDPQSLEAHAGLARALIQERRFVAAEEPLRRALELGDREAQWLLQLASVLWETGDLEEADALFREARQRAPGSGLTARELGRFLLWRGEFQEAAAQLEEALRLGESGFAIRLDRARALEGVARELSADGDRDGEVERVLAEAHQAFREAVELAPEHSGARFGLARVAARLGRQDEARRELETFERLYREDQERTRRQGLDRARLDTVRVLLRDGRSDEALALLETMPEGIETLRLVALAARDAGDLEAAATALERALVLEPGQADLRALLVEVRLEAAGD